MVGTRFAGCRSMGLKCQLIPTTRQPPPILNPPACGARGRCPRVEYPHRLQSHYWCQPGRKKAAQTRPRCQCYHSVFALSPFTECGRQRMGRSRRGTLFPMPKKGGGQCGGHKGGKHPLPVTCRQRQRLTMTTRRRQSSASRRASSRIAVVLPTPVQANEEGRRAEGSVSKALGFLPTPAQANGEGEGDRAV